jgi:hypothetical protein
MVIFHSSKMVYEEYVMDDLYENLKKLMNHTCFLHSRYSFNAEVLNLKVTTADTAQLA